MIEEKVILVNEKDEQIGTMPKMEAHEKALLHRAFSVFIFNDKNELMLQQRAAHKYHSPLLWTNTCCSHQRVGETNIQAGKRRLMEEMGFVVELEDIISFIYKAPFDNGLTEHEFDHVLIGKFNQEPIINPDEVASWKWMPLENVKNDMVLHPEIYTEWFKIIFEKFYQHINILGNEGNGK
jgi:isopentenyl-diphosphate delta-isomerase